MESPCIVFKTQRESKVSFEYFKTLLARVKLTQIRLAAFRLSYFFMFQITLEKVILFGLPTLKKPALS